MTVTTDASSASPHEITKQLKCKSNKAAYNGSACLQQYCCHNTLQILIPHGEIEQFIKT